MTPTELAILAGLTLGIAHLAVAVARSRRGRR